MPEQYVKVNLRVAEGAKVKGRRGVQWVTWKIGHKAALPLSKLLINTCVHIAEFWMNIGCGSTEETNTQLHKAAAELATLEWREEADDPGDDAKRSRLEEIRELVQGSNEDTFFDRAIVADLLAVVDAELKGTTPQQQVLALDVCLGLETGFARREDLHAQRDAWLDLR